MVVNQYQSMVLNDLWNLFVTLTRWHPVTFSVQQNFWNLISTKLMVLNPGTKLQVLNPSTKIINGTLSVQDYGTYSWHPLAPQHPVTFRILPCTRLIPIINLSK